MKKSITPNKNFEEFFSKFGVNIDFMRIRPQIYIGGIKTHDEDITHGMYYLFRDIEKISIREWMLGFCNRIDIHCEANTLTIREFGRGVDSEVLHAVFENHTISSTKERFFSEKEMFDLNKASALCRRMTVISFYQGVKTCVQTSQGKIISFEKTLANQEPDGLYISLSLDKQIFGESSFNSSVIETMLNHDAACNPGLCFHFNNSIIQHTGGMQGLLKTVDNFEMKNIIHITDNLFDLAISPATDLGQGKIISFINDDYTMKNGYHVSALKFALFQILKQYKPYKNELKSGMEKFFANCNICFNILIESPIFEDAMRCKFTGLHILEDGTLIRDYLMEKLQNSIQKIWIETPEKLLSLVNGIISNEIDGI